MKTEITVDSAGRILIPKELRDQLGLGPGNVLAISVANEQITLKPLRPTIPLEKRRGFWVYAGQTKHLVAEAIERLISDDRDARATALMAEETPRKSSESVFR